MAWGPSRPPWAGRSGERGAAPSHGARAVEVGKERWSGTPSSRGLRFPLPSGKLKARNKDFPFSSPRRVLVGFEETSSRTRAKSSYIYMGRAASKNTSAVIHVGNSPRGNNKCVIIYISVS